MSHVKPKDTTQEIIIRKLIFSMGYRYRLHYQKLPGKPDIALTKYKKVIFINGCFWHGHNCKRAALPVTNIEFWENKISGNIKRDNENYQQLNNLGWKYLIVWQCEIKKKEIEELKDKIINFIEK
jgi:DNA mismatch endonuclease, patch repair protein